MSYADWKEKTADFKRIDVRGAAGNFFPGLKKQAAETEPGSGLEIIQSAILNGAYNPLRGNNLR